MMLIHLKGVEEPVEIDSTAPIGVTSYPDIDENPVQEHHVHFFVWYDSAWEEISLRSYNKLVAAGNPPQNI